MIYVNLLTETNVTFILASAFFIAIMQGVFQLTKTTEKMGDDIK
jgi:hypothetical protein